MNYRVPNWHEYQHYRDRHPPWIKLHRKLLKNRGFMALPLMVRGLLPLVWLLASESGDGTVDGPDEWIAERLQLPPKEVQAGLAALLEAGFLNIASDLLATELPDYMPLSDKVRAQVMLRDGAKCQNCGATSALEIDHIKPRAAGGTNDIDNLQVLCSPCNKSKGTRANRLPIKRDLCPHEQIVALYHELLPSCPRIRFWDERRRKYLRARWLEDPKRQDLDWWRKFFEYVARSPFLTGRTNGSKDRPPFLADLEWLVRPTNFVHVIEGKYEERARAH